jgi:hypothetical protein
MRFFDAPAVQLDLRFSGALVGHCTARAALAREIFAHSGEPGQHVLQTRVLHLHRGLRRMGAPAEDLQDQARAVDHFRIQPVGEIDHLRRGKRVVENDAVALLFEEQSAQFLDFPAADAGGGVDGREALCDRIRCFKPRAPARPSSSFISVRNSTVSVFCAAPTSMARFFCSVSFSVGLPPFLLFSVMQAPFPVRQTGQDLMPPLCAGLPRV